MGILETAHRTEVRAKEPDLKLILAVERKRPFDDESAHRSERQPLHVTGLRGILPHPVDLAHRLRLRIADRKGADSSRRRQIALEQDRRHAEHVGDVVEPGTRVVARQQRRGVDVQCKEITNRVRVFGTIQAMDEGPTGVRCTERAAVESCLERGNEGVTRISRRSGHPGWRHHAGPELPGDLLPHLRIRGDVGQIRGVEGQPRGSASRAVTRDAGTD